MRKFMALFAAVLISFSFYSFAGGTNTAPGPPLPVPEVTPPTPAPGGQAQPQCNPPQVPQRWVEVQVHEGSIGVDVEGPGPAESNQWAVVSIHSNSAYGVEIAPDSYLDTRDGMHLGRAVSGAGDEIGYYLMVKDWPKGPRHTIRDKPFRMMSGPRTSKLALGAQTGGDYTRDRSAAKVGEYRGLVNIYAYVLN